MNHSRVSAALVAVFVAGFGGSELAAQRRHRSFAHRGLDITIFHDGSISNGRKVIAAAKEFEQVQTGCKPGDYCALSPEQFLVCGQAPSGTGILRWFTRDASMSLQLTGTATVPGADLVGVAYDATTQWLYLLDHTQHRIVRAIWSGAGPLPQAFAVWADAAAIPVLVDTDDYRLAMSHDPQPKLLLLEWDWREIDKGYRIEEHGGDVLLVSLDAPGGGLLIDWGSARAGQASLRVRAPEGAGVEVLRDGAVVGAAAVPSTASAVDVPLDTAMSIGQHYEVRAVGGEVADRLVCVGRYGVPEALASGIELGRIPRPVATSIGMDDLRLNLPLRQAAWTGNRSTLGGVMAVALLTDESRQVVSWNGNALLLADVFVTATGLVGWGRSGFLSSRLPIPNDQDLVGRVVLIQYHVPENVAGSPCARRSEVFAFTIEPGRGAAAPGPGGGDAFLRWAQALCRRGEAVYDPTFVERTYGKR